MFINTGGLPEQHRFHIGGKHNLQPQRHHHGHRHLQQFQLHQPNRSRRLAAPRHLLLPDPRHHGSLFPAALLLKPGSQSPLFSASTILPHPPHPIIPPSPALLLSPSLHRDHKTNMDGLHNLICPPCVMIKKYVIQEISFNKGGFASWRSSLRPPIPVSPLHGIKRNGGVSSFLFGLRFHSHAITFWRCSGLQLSCHMS